MATRVRNKLSSRFVQTVTEAGRHSDGGGLYLVIDRSGAKRWTFIFRWQGRQPEMGLGGYPTVSLAEARKAAEDAARLVQGGTNPIEARREQEKAAVEVPTFGKYAEELVDEIQGGFRNAKHIQQWRNTLATYGAPIANKPLDQIGTDDILKCLKPIWLGKAETASRLRGRIERVLDAAKAKGLRSGENPARWRGHLDALLPKRQKLQRGHHAAMPFEHLPEFVMRLQVLEAVAARALEFLVLTAARSGEVRGATWDEFDLEAKLWTIPAKRMKAGREHRVPLTPRAVQIIDEMEQLRSDDQPHVFPGQKRGRPLSVMAMDMLLRRMKIDDATVHGFRSSFRDWAGECTSFPREIAEAALAHLVGNAVERAYRRGDALEKRREMMLAWAAFLQPQPGNVVALSGRRQARS